MRVAIVGSRDYPLPHVVRWFVAALATKYPDATVVSGGAKGVDTWAEHAAKTAGLNTLIIQADWHLHGRRAGYLRNEQLVQASDLVVAFWDEKSKGTLHTIEIAERDRVPRYVYGRNGKILKVKSP